MNKGINTGMGLGQSPAIPPGPAVTESSEVPVPVVLAVAPPRKHSLVMVRARDRERCASPALPPPLVVVRVLSLVSKTVMASLQHSKQILFVPTLIPA